MLKDKKTKQIIFYIVFAVILFTCAQHLAFFKLLLLKIFKIILPVIIGLCIAFILNVPMRQVESKIFKKMAISKKAFLRKLPRPLSLVLTLLLTLGAVAIILLIIIPRLKDAIVLLASKLPHYIGIFVAWAEPIIKKFDLNISLDSLKTMNFKMDDVQKFASKFLSIDFSNTDNIISSTFSFTSSVISGVVNTALGFVIAIYVLADKEKISAFTKRFMKNIMPEKVYEKIMECAYIAGDSYASFISGQFTDAFILAVLCFIGMSIFRFPNAAVVSVAIGVSAVIPVIGPFIGEAISFILIFIESPLKAVLFLVFILILQTVDNNLIYPRIVGKKVGLPGILVLVAVIVGGNISGILGVLLGVPTVSAIYSIVLKWMSEREKRRKLKASVIEKDGSDD